MEFSHAFTKGCRNPLCISIMELQNDFLLAYPSSFFPMDLVFHVANVLGYQKERAKQTLERNKNPKAMGSEKWNPEM